MAADCDTEHYLVVAKFRERLSVSKQEHKKLNKVEGKEQYCVKILNRFAALKNLDAEVDINRAWETVRENINSAKESVDFVYEV
jgi:hypothetical protein